jgi:hypothetical protein
MQINKTVGSWVGKKKRKLGGNIGLTDMQYSIGWLAIQQNDRTGGGLRHMHAMRPIEKDCRQGGTNETWLTRLGYIASASHQAP